MRIMICMNEVIQSILLKIEAGENSAFDFGIRKMKRYVESFPIPKDDMERSFFQYKCQMKLNGVIKSACLNFVAIPILIFCLLQCKKSKSNIGVTENAVFFSDGKPDNILPEEVRRDFKKIVSNPAIRGILNKKDIRFIFKLWKRHPFSWLYVSKIAWKISKYRYTINKYRPAAIIVCNEYSFTSSVLTKFCNDNKVEHINVMHGEKYYDMKDSFFRYNRCYIWDKYYKELFMKLKADKEQFIIAIPESLVFKRMNISKTHEYTYYLGNEDDKTLTLIAEKLQILAKSNCVYVRPHPRYSNKRKVAKIFENIKIEDCSKITIEESILSTKYAISLFSTVLNQADHNGTIVVIDDVTDYERYRKLFKFGYIGIRKPHLLLSKILKEQEKIYSINEEI